jgi:hypothetical protein
MMTRRTLIDFSDLKFISIECSKCGTKTVLDVERTSQIERADRGVIPQCCPSCQNDFDPLNHALGRFLRAYVEIKVSKNPVRIEIDTP